MSFSAIILAAGKGTRMESDLPKVLHEVCGRPMLSYVIDACVEAGCDRLLIVVGHEFDKVRDRFSHRDHELVWVPQLSQQGTGHAVMACRRYLARVPRPVLVLAGDGPLLRAETLKQLLRTHQDKQADCTLATSILPEPGRYGRILRDGNGELAGIVEYLDANDRQRGIDEVNVSLYCFNTDSLLAALPHLNNHNAKGEYYLTDVLEIMKSAGQTLAAVPAVPAEEVLSVNTIEQLEQVNEIMARRLAEEKGQ